MVEFVGGKVVIVELPADYGKSLIYASMPLGFDILRGTHRAVSQNTELKTVFIGLHMLDSTLSKPTLLQTGYSICWHIHLSKGYLFI